MKKQTPKMVTIRIPADVRRLLKIMASEEGTTIGALVGLMAVNSKLRELIARKASK